MQSKTLETVTLNVLFYLPDRKCLLKKKTQKELEGLKVWVFFVFSFSAVETFTNIQLRLQLHILWFISLIIPRIENVSFKGLAEFAQDLFFFFFN